jgi:hypothetical protein
MARRQRNLFAALSEGFDALKEGRESEAHHAILFIEKTT